MINTREHRIRTGDHTHCGKRLRRAIPARLCGFVLIAQLVAPTASPQPPTPQLPRLALETYPPSAREAVSRVYQDAAARPSDPQAAGALARVLHAWEQWDAAHQAYVRAQTLAPKQFEWHYLDALVLQRLARHHEAAERLRAALALSPQYLAARVKLADAMFEAGALAESRRLFDALVEDPASEPMGEFGLGRIDAAEGRHEAAIAHFQRAITLFPEWGAAHYALALSSRALGRRDEAQRALERHAQYGTRWPAVEDPVSVSVADIRQDPRAILQRGLKLVERGDLEGAIAAHEEALARDPSLGQAHANLISLYGRAKDWAKAEQHYRAAVAQGIDLADAHYDYGVMLGLQEKWDAAADAYRKALAVNPLHARARNNLGDILERQRKFEAALAEYNQAVTAEPLFRLARFNSARMLLALARPDAAIVELEKVVEPRDAETPRYLFALAVAHVRAGHKEEGIKKATEAQQLAIEYGQHDLAAAIQRDLAQLK
jgi:tetratricopeptide (TPR) repeat protein